MSLIHIGVMLYIYYYVEGNCLSKVAHVCLFHQHPDNICYMCLEEIFIQSIVLDFDELFCLLHYCISVTYLFIKIPFLRFTLSPGVSLDRSCKGAEWGESLVNQQNCWFIERWGKRVLCKGSLSPSGAGFPSWGTNLLHLTSCCISSMCFPVVDPILVKPPEGPSVAPNRPATLPPSSIALLPWCYYSPLIPNCLPRDPVSCNVSGREAKWLSFFLLHYSANCNVTRKRGGRILVIGFERRNRRKKRRKKRKKHRWMAFATRHLVLKVIQNSWLVVCVCVCVCVNIQDCGHESK